MRKIILAAIAAVTIASPALAGGTNIRCTHSKFFGTNCAVTDIVDPPPPTEAEIAEKNRQIAEWEDFCKPVGKPDALGMIRLTYAQPGCEFGRRK